MGKHVDENRPLIVYNSKPLGFWDRPYALEWDWSFSPHKEKGTLFRRSGWVRVYTDEIGD